MRPAHTHMHCRRAAPSPPRQPQPHALTHPPPLPPQVKSSDVSADKDLIPKPATDKHVVARALEDCGHVVVDSEGASVDLARGEALVIRYGAIAQLLHDGKVELV